MKQNELLRYLLSCPKEKEERAILLNKITKNVVDPFQYSYRSNDVKEEIQELSFRAGFDYALILLGKEPIFNVIPKGTDNLK